MTIAMIGQKGLPARSGGIERHVEALASGLASNGHRVIVYGRRWYVGDGRAPAGVEQTFTSGIRTKHLDAITHSFTALLAARRERPDIVHLHGCGIALLAPLARLILPKAKIVVTFHCIDRVLPKWGKMARFAFRLGEWMACHVPHRTIVVSEFLLRYCLERYECQGTYVTQPLCPTDVSHGHERLQMFGVEPDRYLLFVGRLIPSKHVHTLLHAYSSFQAKCEAGSAPQLAIVGGASWTDAYVKRVQALAKCIPNVRMLGACDAEVTALLQEHALGHVFPSTHEGMSFALLEAAMSGRPIVAADIAPNREALSDQAIFVRPGDALDLHDGLMRLHKMSSADRQALARKARIRVSERYASCDRVDEVDGVYHELMTGSSALVSHALVS